MATESESSTKAPAAAKKKELTPLQQYWAANTPKERKEIWGKYPEVQRVVCESNHHV